MNSKNIVLKNNVSSTLKYLRLRKKLKQNEVANFINTTRSAYANYEQGRRIPNLKMISKLSELYDTSIDSIIGKDKEKVVKNEIYKIVDNIEDKNIILTIIEELKTFDLEKKMSVYNFIKFMKQEENKKKKE